MQTMHQFSWDWAQFSAVAWYLLVVEVIGMIMLKLPIIVDFFMIQ